ncbi:acyl-CoA synthetase (AMP-forming)/AMP-acid ligase II [Bradyrhizobium japonicum]
MIDLGAKRGDRLASLSGNSIEQAIVTFAAMSVGVVVAPITPNYSLMPGRPGSLAGYRSAASALIRFCAEQ